MQERYGLDHSHVKDFRFYSKCDGNTEENKAQKWQNQIHILQGSFWLVSMNRLQRGKSGSRDAETYQEAFYPNSKYLLSTY